MTTNCNTQGYKEIEFKAIYVELSQFESAIELLHTMVRSQEATFNGIFLQEDYYVDHELLKGSQFELYSKGEHTKSLRIRRGKSAREPSAQDGSPNHSMCLKVAHKGATQNDHERREFEVKIDNPDTALEIFKLLGFSIEKILKKKRRSFFYQNYEIVLDEVVGFKKVQEKYEQEFSSYILEVELKDGAEEIEDVTACLEEMKRFIEKTLHVTKYKQEQSGIEKYR